MATVFVFIESAADTPLTGASPVLDYWEKDTPGAPVATSVALTELVGGIGGAYFADVATTDGLEYVGIIDATAGAAAGTRYRMVTFSGTTDARIETDIPLILARLTEAWTSLGLNIAAPASFDAQLGWIRALAASIDIAITVVGSTVTLTRQ